MIFNDVKLSDKEMFDSYLAGKNHNLITYCFSNFFIWRNWDPYTWTKVGDALVVKSNFNGLDTICIPISPNYNAVFNATETMIEYYKEQNKKLIISEVSSVDMALLTSKWPDRFIAEEYPPGFNYIYNHSDLASLSGKKFDGKRNHINRFIRNHPDYSFLPLTPKLASKCVDLLTKWQSISKAKSFESNQEFIGTRDALKYYQELGCIGAALLIGDDVVAFTIGEPLNEDTFCIHIEKADIKIKGCYQMINQLFAKELINDYPYINRAEDMGIKGLKKAKLSYHPCRLEKKYYLRLKND